ncbi:uncharacterized protein YjbI with pentapeptide repeats [Plasticicumulans lactativorans]|uniref:Uncharacterized protein YjbI with pentapeptide repeats n=1 Tax=Plasticicumulans lactativorans TaxID=1133106 RepID=A0A4R2LR00_9GAMM|nr:pentapeptide repeat-containing protein [Plasticicumulans lactativorans]TCO82011.1 uncharacterized protein YjbI with pentapeptide repeats [Plasticicumulans lactativorans]
MKPHGPRKPLDPWRALATGMSTPASAPVPPPAPATTDAAAAPATEPATTPAPEAAPTDATPSGKDLLDTVNAAAGTVAGLHVAFMALSAYVVVTVWGTTHRDLALDSPVKLPLIDVQVGLTSFYAAVPWLYWLVHLNLLIQFELLARKTWAFSTTTDYAALAPRLYLFPFVHYLLHGAGRLVRPLLAVAVFTSVIAFPWFVLLFVQVKFLAYHSEAITWSQRGAVWMDAITVRLLWPLIASRSGIWESGFQSECWHDKSGRKIGASPWLATRAMAIGFLITVGFATVALVPGQRYETQGEGDSAKLVWHLDGFEGQLVRWLNRSTLSDWGRCRWLVGGALTLRVRAEAADKDSEPPAACADQDVRGKLGPTLWLTAWLFDPHRDARGRAIGTEAEPLLARLLPERYLDLHGEVLLDEKPSAEVRHALRGDLDRLPAGRTITGAGAAPAPAENASEKQKTLKDALAQTVPLGKLKGRDLQGADLSGAVLPLADLSESRLAGANLVSAQIQGARLNLAYLQGASLDRANLQGARLDFAQLQGARLDFAQLQGASLVGAQLQGARLDFAQLQGAYLVNAQLQGARLDFAQLQGARLDGAQLQGASLVGARLQGASLDGARLQGARLFTAQLQGASLFTAQLQGASLGGAQLQGASLDLAQLDAADLSRTALAGATGTGVSAEAAALRGVSDQLLSADAVEALRQGVEPYLDPGALEAFTARLAAARQQGFGTLRITGDCFGPEALGCREQGRDFAAFRAEKHLPALMRRACADADVARGLTRRWSVFERFLRGIDTGDADFGLAQALAARLGDADCQGLAALTDADRETLEQAVADEQDAAARAPAQP